MKVLGNIIELFISKEKYDGRINQAELAIDENGVFIDKFYGKDKERSILIASTKAYDIVRENKIAIDFGQLGENILIDFDVTLLKEGTQLKIGEVVLEITQNCTICDHLSKIDSEVPVLLKNDRGVFAKVIAGGLIKKGFEVKSVLENDNG
jgi:MOSC domain-containing protein YiiM